MQVSVLRRALRLFASSAIAMVAYSACTTTEPGQSTNHSGLSWTGPPYAGAGVAGLGQSLAAGLPALTCGTPSAFSFTKGPVAASHSHLSCFFDANNQASASVEWIVESGDDGNLIHVRLTLNPDFVDNTYGANCIGWPAMQGPMGMMGMMTPPAAMGPAAMQPPPMAAMMANRAPHTFNDLVESDHAEFKLSDAAGKLVLHFKEDYISKSSAAPSGYETLGVSGGDGAMISGDPKSLVAFSTSLDRDLNACSLSTFTADSPATDENYTPAKGAEAWDYRVVYDVWVDEAAFGSSGFGDAVVDFVHASPSKSSGGPTATVSKGPCPPSWNYCTNSAGCSDDHCVDMPDETCTDHRGEPESPPPTSDVGSPG